MNNAPGAGLKKKKKHQKHANVRKCERGSKPTLSIYNKGSPTNFLFPYSNCVDLRLGPSIVDNELQYGLK